MDQRQDNFLQFAVRQLGEIDHHLQRAFLPLLDMNALDFKVIPFQQIHQFIAQRFVIHDALFHLHRHGIQSIGHALQDPRLTWLNRFKIIGDQIKDMRKLR